MSCPLCGSYFPPGYGHACVPRAPLPTSTCENGCVLPCRCATRPNYPKLKPRRTVCADCRWCGNTPTSFDFNDRLCKHENARHLISGKPTECSTRNFGNCPDFEEKQP